jgi:hypothetical protein
MNRKNEEHKRATQNQRILKDFPWLWAIRNVWSPIENKITILGLDHDLLGFLSREAWENRRLRVQIWLCFLNETNGTMRVENINADIGSRESWGELILSHPYFGVYCLSAIIFDNNAADYGQVDIHRFKKPLTKDFFKKILSEPVHGERTRKMIEAWFQ